MSNTPQNNAEEVTVLKYFLDTEFIEKPNIIQLISVGIKCEDGRKYFALSSEYNYADADNWVKENVLMQLYNQYVVSAKRLTYNLSNFHKHYGKKIKEIRQEILDFVGYPEYIHGKPEFYGYFADYDWVVFCWIFGKMVDLPVGFPMYCKDLKQLLDESGKEKLPDPKGEHSAIVDAEWNEKLYNYLMEIKK